MIIYVDVLFVENLILDFIIILATEIICNIKFRFWKTLLGSSVGSLLTIFSTLTNINRFIFKILISFVIVFIVFGFKTKKKFVKILSVFYLTTITFGGASFLLMFSVNPKEILYNAGHFLGIYPVKMAIGGGVLGFVLIVWVQKILRKKFNKTCDIEIGYKDKEVKIKALIDSRKFT